MLIDVMEHGTWNMEGLLVEKASMIKYQISNNKGMTNKIEVYP